MLKKGMTQINLDSVRISSAISAIPSVMTNVYVVAGLIVMVISMGAHLLVLSKVDISFAYPFLGLSFVLITMWGHFALAEPLNISKVAGVVLIVGGVILVARS